MTKKYNEHVLCFPTELLKNLPRINKIRGNTFYQYEKYADGFSLNPGPLLKYSISIFVSDECVFIDRNLCEKDENFKQIIPYVMLAYANEGEGVNRYLVCQRGSSGGEGRLHGQYYIGMGGHINLTDACNDTRFAPKWCYANCISRELNEELGLPDYLWLSSPKEVAVINDDSNPVGRVHFGIASILNITKETADNLVFEDSAKNPQWKTLSELKEMALEGWSRLLVDHVL